MMMLILRERIVQRGRRQLSMEPRCLENHHLVKSMKANQVHLRQLFFLMMILKKELKFNPYARYNVKHGKNPHAKIFYIKKQKEAEKPKEVVYSNSKIVQIIKTYWEVRHKHKFITEIIARRGNGSIMLIIKSDYKNLNKNDIEDMYMLIINGKVDDYAETGLMWSLSVFIRSTMIWERVHDF
ncbi:hypothetical protein Tco_1126304 [Tanacetum coccineum]